MYEWAMAHPVWVGAVLGAGFGFLAGFIACAVLQLREEQQHPEPPCNGCPVLECAEQDGELVHP